MFLISNLKWIELSAFQLIFFDNQFFKKHFAKQLANNDKNAPETPEAHSDPRERSKMKPFAKIVKGWKSLIIN